MTAEADAAAGGGPVNVPTKRPGASAKEQKATKRQRRKQVNETNKWPQHPKIQDMEVRSKAYIRVAGLGSSTKKKETMDPTLDLMSPEVKFGRLLGSTDQRKRHAAVQKLKSYLKARCDINNEKGGVSEMDLLKLWKGLWYTLYMADKVPVQHELSKHLAELLWCVAGTEEEDEYAGQVYMDMCEAQEEGEQDDDDSEVILEEVVNTLDDSDGDDDEQAGSDHEGDRMDEDQYQEEEDEDSLDDSEIPHCRGAHLASLFIRTFFRTVRREWGNMDKYRVDKFYTLSRLYIHEIFKYMAMRHWNLGIIRLFNDAMFDEVLNQKPNGLRYHLIDIVLDELAKVSAKAPMSLTEATFLDTLEPYFAMTQTGAGGDDTVQTRVMENVLEKFLNKYSVVSDVAISEDDENKEAKDLIFDQVHVGTVAQFIFELASDPETKDQYRKSLYEMHKLFMRRLKTVGKDVPINEDNDVENDPEIDEEVSAGEDSDVDEEHVHSVYAKEKIPLPEPKHEETGRKRKELNPAGGDEQPSEKVDTPPKKRNRKKKRKGGSAQESAPTSAPAADDEEVVTISLGDQKKAKAQEKKAKEAGRVESEANLPVKPASSDKRVKWLPNNKSKSYTASIKGLMNAAVPKTSEVTPEKSILLNKGKVRRAGVTAKAGRKKAVNYF